MPKPMTTWSPGEYVDEAEDGNLTHRPEFCKMVKECNQPHIPFQVVLAWRFSRFTHNPERDIVFRSMLRRRGVKIVSIAECTVDAPPSKALNEFFEEIVDIMEEFHLDSLTRELVR